MPHTLFHRGTGMVASDGTFPVGSGQIWLDDVDCDEYDQNIADCGSNGWGVHNCGHFEDVGVICGDRGTKMKFFEV